MKKSIKLVSITFLAGTFLINCMTPVFSQGYQKPYNNYSSGYNQPTYNSGNSGYNRSYYGNSNYNMPPLQGRVSIPAGTSLPVTISTTMSSQYARIGDQITARLGQDMYSGGTLALPAGTTIQGRLVDAQPAGMFGRSGRLNARFDTAITPNGKRYNISGKIYTQDGTGIVYGGTAASMLVRAAKDTAIGSAVGAVSGVALGGITGRPGRGTWAGTAIGGGTGLLGSFITKGAEAVIDSNSRIDIILDQPMEDNNNGGYSNY